ncbi:sensor domain-containing diguanylate cyclase [bacterium SCSIO 12696]|nr:sensor domain-containing diguanylate cyclase [bacterium SCSIO 12696]
MNYPIPENEEARIKALAEYQLLDTLPEQEYDDIVQVAAQVCKTSMSTVVLVDKKRNWLKAKYGTDQDSVPREMGICTHVILQRDMMVVNDTHKHPVFKDLEVVTKAPHIRFYAGVPIFNPQQHALGTLCVLDHQPKALTQAQQDSLKALSRFVGSLFDMRRSLVKQEFENKLLQKYHSDITQVNNELKALSLSDELTGLRNRRAFNQELKREFASHKRYSTPLSLLLLDLDNFKQVNDNYGHQAGDKALEIVANLMLPVFRDSDLLARYGGEEFAVLLPNTNLADAQKAAERIRRAIANNHCCPQKLTVSIGAASADEFDDAARLIKQADEALYRAKQQGRNRVCL